ncbi:OpgC domain-containing protein [Azospirillum sp. YIM B02556]|uniref:OpgC domain-containing protein n=1 Tax=Azospirillum endophyticum TaxID=2800326 RepID=A0ABS1F989_9PROT|nr:OpgC domain-containing protein [Azospirillum endophyticum]MBK1839998.1 OpgC domain-containing protein [Azospirillum endophyticum]
MQQRQARDPRLDLFKGMALLIIFINHVGGNPLAKLMPARFGPSDSAEIFVFISGYAIALAYAPVLAERGFAACQRKALDRCRQLWVANILTMLVSALVVALAVHIGDLPMAASNRLQSFAPLFDTPVTAMAWNLVLMYLPFAFDILALYILLVAVAPLFLWTYARFGYAAIAVSLLLYLVAQAAPGLIPPNLWDEDWNFSPLAWQCVFFLGTSLALIVRSGRVRLPRSRWLLGSALALLAGMAVWKFAASDIGQALAPAALRDWLPEETIPWADKDTLGPMRLLHFLALACAAALLVPRDAGWLRSAPARLLVACGRHSLPVFCVGVVLSIAGSALLVAEDGAFMVLVVNMVGIAVLLAMALVLERRRTRRQSVKSAVPSAAMAETP